MPTKKKEPEPPWQVILEEIRSQNRATIEAVEVNRESLEQQIGELRHETGVRFDTLERAVRACQDGIAANQEGIAANQEGIAANQEAIAANQEAIAANQEAIAANQEGITGNREKVEQVERTLAARMDLLEEVLGRMDQESRSRDASLEVAIRELKVSVQQNSLDLRDLGAKMEALSRLEERVAALERRSA